MFCGDLLDLRQEDYEIDVWPTDYLYVADFHKQMCVTPGGNFAHLQFFKEDTANGKAEYGLCKRLTLNGWEIFSTASTDQVFKFGLDSAKYGE